MLPSQPIERREEHWIPRQQTQARVNQCSHMLGARALAVLPVGERPIPSRVKLVLEPLSSGESYPDHDDTIDYRQIAEAEGKTPGWFACINEYR